MKEYFCRHNVNIKNMCAKCEHEKRRGKSYYLGQRCMHEPKRFENLGIVQGHPYPCPVCNKINIICSKDCIHIKH